MSNLYSAAEAAEKIGCNKSTVCRACDRHSIGRLVGRQRILTESDISRLQAVIQDKPGNPKFNAGNYFGGTKKRPKKAKK